ncbi:MAG: hypothetical protein IPN33_02515 [Saprospiraceae bacterium]|nr:hypothetical protein [Saprospiraceae bacterium]
MTRRIYIFLMILMAYGGNAQNSVLKNKVITTTGKKMGVVSQSGDILIDTIYSGVSPFFNKGRKTLPPTNKISKEVVEMYLVSNDNQYAVFDKDGLKLFGFEECFQVEVDEHTKTIVKILKQDDNQLRSYLYGFDGKLIFDTSFENVGYINNSDLIALIAEDGQNDEFYLYNPFTKVKLGPYSHFNIYNEDSSPPLGMDEKDFEKYTSLNVITVRQDSSSKYIWGMIDMQGNELHPLVYKHFRVIDKDLRERFIDRSSRPEGVEFLFYAHLFSGGSMLLFDEKMEKYIYEHESMTIVKEE